MSQRSILEINHDCSFEINNADPLRFIHLLQRALASGSDESWEPLKRYGIRRITQCHHSEDRKLIINEGGIRREYEFS